MRIIGGEFRSRRLKTLPGLDTRPTPDRLREALFNILAPSIEGAVFLDAYAGTGAVGLEALSRGAARTILVEQSRAAVSVIQANLRALGIENRAEVLHTKALKILGRRRAEIVFLDPPYRLAEEYAEALRLLGAAPPPLVLVQHDAHLALAETYDRLERYRILKQGENRVSFYRPAEAPAPRPDGRGSVSDSEPRPSAAISLTGPLFEQLDLGLRYRLGLAPPQRAAHHPHHRKFPQRQARHKHLLVAGGGIGGRDHEAAGIQ
ncbi:MAG: 16S rRNA (guanine(966)-N(2))-methyltransferase RsmD [Acidobacteria bacterium]|nr:16S rRNA (guanine(966)-N(2))-methyltransferase RsmD [Acidobacteriota bacterium]